MATLPAWSKAWFRPCASPIGCAQTQTHRRDRRTEDVADNCHQAVGDQDRPEGRPHEDDDGSDMVLRVPHLTLNESGAIEDGMYNFGHSPPSIRDMLSVVVLPAPALRAAAVDIRERTLSFGGCRSDGGNANASGACERATWATLYATKPRDVE
jgi:hypothetical protein